MTLTCIDHIFNNNPEQVNGPQNCLFDRSLSDNSDTDTHKISKPAPLVTWRLPGQFFLSRVVNSVVRWGEGQCGIT